MQLLLFCPIEASLKPPYITKIAAALEIMQIGHACHLVLML